VSPDDLAEHSRSAQRVLEELRRVVLGKRRYCEKRCWR
jgi:hypothetical protein